MDMASPVRERIYAAIRAFTSATVAEAEAATRAIIRLVDDALPYDGSCVRCGCAPRSASGLCNTCLDADAERDPGRRCDVCGGEGRIYSGHPNDPHPRDEGECGACDGTGWVEPVRDPTQTVDDLDNIKF